MCARLTQAHQGVFLVPESCSASCLLLTVCHFCLFFLEDLFTITNVLLLDELMSYSDVTQPENIYIQAVFRSYTFRSNHISLISFQLEHVVIMFLIYILSSFIVPSSPHSLPT